MKRLTVILLVTGLLFTYTACGNKQQTDANATEFETEMETEVMIPIADANNILNKVWDNYESVDTDGNMYNDKFSVMGGHFESAVMDMPGKYDLTQTSDLELMYCVPASVVSMIDDAATMVHLMKASTITVGAYHIADSANVQTVVEGIKQQTLGNQWLGGFPDDLVIVRIDDQYVVSIVGNAEVVDVFYEEMLEIYGKQVTVLVKESIR